MGSRYQYGILIENTVLADLKNPDSINGKKTGLLGKIVKIESILKNNYTVRLLKENETWETTTYICPHTSLIYVDEKLWPFLDAIPSPQERVKLAQNKVRCDKLMQITRDTLVGYSTEHDIHLGKVKFIGFVKGLGKCFGIQLHTKLPGNNCNGMYAGIQYFVCLPGHGKFTTIEKLMPQHYENETSPVTKRPLTEYEETVARNLSGFTDSTRSKETRGISARNPNFFRTSHSMQNLSETNNFTINSNKQNSSSITQNNQTTTINSYNQSVNSNNEFDQNMLLQPDKTHLIDDKTMSHISSNHKTKSEIDLKDVIAGIWSETTEPVQPHYYSDLKQLCKQTGDAKSTLSDKSYGSYNNTLSKTSSSARNKSLNPLSHIVNGSKTLPKKTKYNLDRVQNKDNKSVFVSTKHVEILPRNLNHYPKSLNAPCKTLLTL